MEHDEEGGPDLPYDLDTISLITGINAPHLRRMLDGKMLPNQAHMDQLVYFLGVEKAALFNTHSLDNINYVEGRYGKPPSGYKLLRYTPASNIKVGDLVAYRPAHRFASPAWIEVLGVEIGDTLISVTVSDTVIQLQTTVPVRIARPITGE